MKIQVINAGVPGQNTADMLARFDTSVAVHLPDLIILLAGTNDLLNSFNSLPAADYRFRMKTLLEKIRAIGAECILINLLPCNEHYLLKRHEKDFFGTQTPNDKLANANMVLQEIATAARIPLVDANTLFRGFPLDDNPTSLLRNPANSCAEDGVHPTAQGYLKLALAVYETIKSNAINAEKIVCLGDSITFGQYVNGEGTADPAAETYPAYLFRLLLIP